MDDLWTALALVMIIEGLLPFATPQAWRESMRRITELDDRTLRIMGAVALILGVLILQIVPD